MPEQNAKNDTTMLLVRMSTDSTADGVTLSSPSVHNSPRSTVAMRRGLANIAMRSGKRVDQPRAGDRRETTNSSDDGQQVHAHARASPRARGRASATAARARSASRGPMDGVVQIRVDRLEIFGGARSGRIRRQPRGAELARGAAVVVDHGERVARRRCRGGGSTPRRVGRRRAIPRAGRERRAARELFEERRALHREHRAGGDDRRAAGAAGRTSRTAVRRRRTPACESTMRKTLRVISAPSAGAALRA